MSIAISSEDFWGCRLDSGNKSFRWELPESDEGLTHKLFVSQATLASLAKDQERNVVEIEVESDEGVQSFSVASLKIGLNETIGLNLGFTTSVTFKLTCGSGPVDLVGSHLVGMDNEAMEDDQFNDMDSEDETENSQLTEITNGLKGKGLPVKKQNVKDISTSVQEDSDDESDEDDEDEDNESDQDESDDEEDEDESEPEDTKTPPKKLKDGVGKSKAKKTNDKKMNKENKPEKKVSFADAKSKDKKGNTGMTLDAIKKTLSHNKTLPKSQEKFENFLKSNLKVTDKKLMGDAWLWYQKTKLSS